MTHSDACPHLVGTLPCKGTGDGHTHYAEGSSVMDGRHDDDSEDMR